jgi:hypothetical protein
MKLPDILEQRETALIAELSAITAFKHVLSKQASATIKQASKLTDSTSVELRKSMTEFEKQLSLQDA